MCYVPYIRIEPGGLSVYDVWEGRRYRNRSSFLRYLNPPKEKLTYTGVLSPSSIKRLRWAINLLVAQALPKQAYNKSTQTFFTFRINFITLTLPAAQGDIKDREITRNCLKRWLESMAAVEGRFSYVWRAERQYNGNVHYHISTDRYLPYDRICQVWNHYLAKYHFIEDYRERNTGEFPNSTDVHSVQKIRNLAAYMVKYMCKSQEDHLKEKNRALKASGKPEIIPETHMFQRVPGQPKWNDPIDGAVWACSKNLNSKDRVLFVRDIYIEKWISAFANTCPERLHAGNHSLFIDLNEDEIKEAVSVEMWAEYQKWLQRVRNH